MSGNRDELPEQGSGNTQGSSRSRQEESRQEIAERLGIDPSQVTTRDTLDRGVEQRLTDEGESAAEQQLRQETAGDEEFVQPGDLQADIDPETFAGSASLTDEGRQRVEERQAEQLRQETAADREFVQPGDLQADVDPETFAGAATLTEEGRAAARQRQADKLRSEAASESERFDEDEFVVDRNGEEVTVEPAESALDRERRETAAAEFESSSEFVDDVEPADVELTDDGAELADSVIESAESRATAERDESIEDARADFAADLESGEAFDTPEGVDPSALVEDIDPNEDIVVEDGELTLTDDVADRINSQVESGSIDQQRQEFADALESGEAFEDGEAPEALGDVDPQTDVTVEDDRLTLADETQRDLVESQIRSQVGDTPGLNTGGSTLGTVVKQSGVLDQIEQDIESQSPRLQDVTLQVQDDGTVEVGEADILDRRIDGFTDVEDIRARTDRLQGVDTEVDAVERFESEIRDTLADRVDEQNVVDVSPQQIDLSGGGVAVDAAGAFAISDDEITADGLTDAGQETLALRQLQSIQSAEGVGVATPIDSQPFANVSGALSQDARSGSLSSATDIVAASSAVGDTADLIETPDAQIIAGLDPGRAGEIEGISADQVREAQRDIRQREQAIEDNPGDVLQSIADNEQEFIEDTTRIGEGTRRGNRTRKVARERLNQIEADIAAGEPGTDASDIGLSLTDDLEGIRSINAEGRQAIADQAAESLPNFAGGEIDVSVDDGEIQTSIDERAREQFSRQAEAIQEIQARNEIADTTEGIDRRDIEVEAGEGVSPTDQLVTDTLGSDADADIESFDQLEAAADIQAREEARQQAIEAAESQTIGGVDPRDVSVERTEDGFEANLSGTAAQTTNLSAVDAAAPVDDAIDIADGQQSSDEPLIEGGEDLPDSIGEVPGAVAGGGEFVDINAPTRPPEIRRAISDTAQDTIGVDIDRDIGRQTLQDARSVGRDIVSGDFDAPDNSGVAGAAGIAVAAPEPVSTGTGAAVLGGLALGGAITSIANNQAEIDVPDRTPASGFSEIDIGQTRQDISEIDVPDRTPATDFGEIDVPDRATTGGEIDIPDQTPASDTGEIGVPSIDAAQLIGRGEFADEEIEEDATTPEISEEDIPANPFDSIQERGGTPERFIREDRDAFVIRNPETPEVDPDEAAEPAVDGAIDTGVGSSFDTSTGVGGGADPIAPVGSDTDTRAGVGSGTEPITAPGSDIDTRPGADVGVGAETGTGIDTDTGVDSDVETALDTRFDTPTREDTVTDAVFAEPAITETVPGFESGFQGRPNRPGRTRRRPRRPNLGLDPDETELAESPEFDSASDLFDSGIASAEDLFDR